MSTGIQWTDETWNPIVGCTVVSAGCDHCYAATLHNRRYLAWKRGWETAPAQYHQPFKVVQLKPERLDQPLKWKAPRKIFVNSLSDLFHEDVPDEYIDRVFGVMGISARHTCQILTKRPERMRAYLSADGVQGRIMDAAHAMKIAWMTSEWPLPNVWLGVSVENQTAADERIPLLLKTPAAIRFLSCEPLLGPVNLREVDFINGYGSAWINPLQGRRVSVSPGGSRFEDTAKLDWVIVGGESGPNARLMNCDWLRKIAGDCRAYGTALFIKQLGANFADSQNGLAGVSSPNTWEGYCEVRRLKDRHGGDWNEWPERMRIREFPVVAS